MSSLERRTTIVKKQADGNGFIHIQSSYYTDNASGPIACLDLWSGPPTSPNPILLQVLQTFLPQIIRLMKTSCSAG
jgi:hypothetical protein